ncbi:MAG TPA: glycine--tRNA ligase subunit beta [Natronincola sp.]|nr:glycine--tRNA ligase subunit beta [Natronincola sp.]
MQDFLLELGFEELPARFVKGALRQLSEAIQNNLVKQRLSFSHVSLYSTPRRLTVLIKDLQLQQEDLVEEIKGPPLNIAKDQSGNLTKAGQGFLRSQGADESSITIKKFQGADYIYVTKETRGEKTAILLKPLLEDVINHLNFPKNMRWGDYDLRFARPLRWIVALLGTDVIPVTVGAVTGDKFTYGHRQLSSGKIYINAPEEYLELLKNSYVIADVDQRRELIWGQITSLANIQNAVVREDERLLEEILNLVEYPTAFCGEFSSEYLNVPTEVLVTSMKEHQRYFPLEDQEGNILPKFIGIRNGADNHLETVITGNEKVIEARLADAKFFYDEDLKINLEQNFEKLNNVVFQEGLGNLQEKVLRIEKLSESLSKVLDYTDHNESIVRTARLAKTDLVSLMVNEFPELQGIMGEKYALAQSEGPNVAMGIREHYMPRFAGDVLPTTIEGTIVSLADKIDTLVGYFALGRIPTGSQDPFALRRQAQGVIQILLHGDFDVSLSKCIQLAAQGYTEVVLGEDKAEALLDFFLARLRVSLLEKGFSADIIDAVLATKEDRVSSFVKRVQALTSFKDERASYADLIFAFGRIANLAKKSEAGPINKSIFEPADMIFYKGLESLDKDCQPLLESGKYYEVLSKLASFETEINKFFDAVMIMDKDEDIRSNRLSLLKQTHELYLSCGDLSIIVDN